MEPFNYSAVEYASLLDLNYTSQHTNTTVKDDKFGHVEDNICEVQQ